MIARSGTVPSRDSAAQYLDESIEVSHGDVSAHGPLAEWRRDLPAKWTHGSAPGSVDS